MAEQDTVYSARVQSPVLPPAEHCTVTREDRTPLHGQNKAEPHSVYRQSAERQRRKWPLLSGRLSRVTLVEIKRTKGWQIKSCMMIRDIKQFILHAEFIVVFLKLNHMLKTPTVYLNPSGFISQSLMRHPRPRRPLHNQVLASRVDPSSCLSSATSQLGWTTASSLMTCSLCLLPCVSVSLSVFAFLSETLLPSFSLFVFCLPHCSLFLGLSLHLTASQTWLILCSNVPLGSPLWVWCSSTHLTALCIQPPHHRVPHTLLKQFLFLTLSATHQAVGNLRKRTVSHLNSITCPKHNT